MMGGEDERRDSIVGHHEEDLLDRDKCVVIVCTHKEECDFVCHEVCVLWEGRIRLNSHSSDVNSSVHIDLDLVKEWDCLLSCFVTLLQMCKV